MLKFIKGHASSIDGIEVYPIVSFTIFFLFFLVLLIYVYRISRAHTRAMADLPLAHETETPKLNHDANIQ